MPTKEDGTIDRGEIVDYTEEYEGQLEKRKAREMLRLIHRTKLTSHAATPIYMYGVHVPQSPRGHGDGC